MDLPSKRRGQGCEVLLLLSICMICAVPVRAGDADFRLPWGREVFTLRPFDGISLRSHYFGEYRFPDDFTSGTKLHLFPNGRFVISKWTDIGPDKLQASGSFRVNGDRLLLEFSRIHPDHEDLKTKFSDLRLFVGQIQKDKYITGFEVFILPADAWAAFQADPEKINFLILQRRAEYNDWQAILKDYEAREE